MKKIVHKKQIKGVISFALVLCIIFSGYNIISLPEISQAEESNEVEEQLTEGRTTEEFATEEITTEEPTTEAPTTEEPTTEEPITTEEPTTEEPTTEEPVEEQQVMEAKAIAVKAYKATVQITFEGDYSFDGVQLLRYDSINKKYSVVKTVKLVDNTSICPTYTNKSSYDYTTGKRVANITDPNNLVAYQKYTYAVRAYKYDDNGGKDYIQTISNLKILVRGEGTKITKAKRVGASKIKLTWSKVKDADGYLIYSVKDHNSKGKYVYTDFTDTSNYKLLKNITSKKKTTYTVTGRKNGYTYGFVIYAYKKIEGKKIKAIPSKIKTVTMDYYAYETESISSRYTRAFGGKNYSAAYKNFQKNYSSSQKANIQMKTISVKVWDYANGESGKKVTKIKYLTVNKNLAPTIKKMFAEIYKSKEKTPIHSLGGYCYESFEPMSPSHQHVVGLAIDINPVENYMIDGDEILAGSFWNPKKSGYSIPLNCDLVRIMKKYGFERGFWGDRKDYMHFSYFGT